MEGVVVVDMLTHVTSGITTVIGWTGTVIDAIVSTDGQLAELGPLFAIGIACSALYLGVKVIRSITWGA